MRGKQPAMRPHAYCQGHPPGSGGRRTASGGAAWCLDARIRLGRAPAFRRARQVTRPQSQFPADTAVAAFRLVLRLLREGVRTGCCCARRCALRLRFACFLTDCPNNDEQAGSGFIKRELTKSPIYRSMPPLRPKAAVRDMPRSALVFIVCHEA